ncbi:MAG: hypothetical protein JSS10_07435 [Verrucomicrobia bacterium]|nr:hypothetical protein [Verrucomicrobiota bacterium]
MRRRSSIFLLEIVIAIFLVGLFSVYFIRSSIHHIYQERKALLDLVFEDQYNLARMKLIAENWNKVDKLPTVENAAPLLSQSFTANLGGQSYSREKNYKVWCASKYQNHFSLILKEDKKKYRFLVQKEAAPSAVPDSKPESAAAS